MSENVYWINHELRQTSWVAPAPSDDAGASESSNSSTEATRLSLPEGWERKIDAKSGRAYYLKHIDKTTSWDFPMHQSSPSKQQVECVVCFEPMHMEPIAGFVSGQQRKRSCRHFLHYRCAMQLKANFGSRHCPVCRCTWDGLMRMPDMDRNPEAWFKFADFDGKGVLSKAEVLDVLTAQFPIDYARLVEQFPALWLKWDVSNTGALTVQDLKHDKLGLLNFIRKEFLFKETTVKAAPDITEDKRVWFLYFSGHDNTMQQEEVVRALIKSYGTAHDSEWMERVREVVASVWAVLVRGGGGGEGAAVDLETFLAPDGLGEALEAAVQEFSKEEELSAAAIAASAPSVEEREGGAPPPSPLSASSRQWSHPLVLLAREKSAGLPLALPRSASGLRAEEVAERMMQVGRV